MKKIEKKRRQRLLKNLIEKNPFLTDKELAEKFEVSVQTIRLDRMELGIPEVRKRTKSVARSAYKQLRSVSEGEVIGDLVQLELDNFAESFLSTTQDMALQSTPIIRGHHIFAQANSLSVAVINAEIVFTGSVEIKFHQPAYVGDVLKARCQVLEKDNKKYRINVNTFRRDTKVFSGDFIMFSRSKEEV